MLVAALPAIADPAARTADGWQAHLVLRFAHAADRVPERTVLVERRHAGPLRVQKALYPEAPAVCQAIIVHPPGGIVGGDTLDIAVTVDAGAHAQLTTPGAAKWYRSAGAPARQRTTLVARAGAVLEWIPQETLLFDGARAEIATRIELAGGARFIGWDVTCLGRTASGERFDHGCCAQSVELLRDGALIWCERTVLEGGSRALQSGAMLGGAPVYGTLVAAGPVVDDGLLAACRAIVATNGEGAVTRLSAALVARFRGASALAARTYFANLWHVLRPAFVGRVAVPPRIWST
jgi:urease accessory protein